MTNSSKQKGISLIEVLISAAILVMLLSVLGAFQSYIFKLNRVIQSGLNTQQNTSRFLRPFASEVRSSTISNIGGFPIVTASSTVLEFYSDADDDGLAEKLRYFLDGNKFKRGSIIPSGDPLVYNSGSEKIQDVAVNIVNGSTPIFEYYDSSYDGVTSSSSLAYPVSLSDVTLVKITLIIDDNPSIPPGPVTFTSQVMFRNLKDN